MPSLAKLMPIDPAVVYVLLPDMFSSKVFTIVFFMAEEVPIPHEDIRRRDGRTDEELYVFWLLMNARAVLMSLTRVLTWLERPELSAVIFRLMAVVGFVPVRLRVTPLMTPVTVLEAEVTL